MSAPADLEYKTALLVLPPALEVKSTALADAPVHSPADVPEGAREVTAVIAVTNVRDEVGDIIVPGAFADTLRERPKPKVCLGHDWNRPIGKTVWIKELPPGDPGLPQQTFDKRPWPKQAGAVLARYIPDMSKQDGRDAYNSAKFFGTEESTFSFGYKTQQADHRNGTRYLKRVAVYEYGPVLNPANRLATLQDIKADEPENLETKAKQVRDTAYWGLPYGTPITGQMHPHGPKARAERRAGRVPLRSMGVMSPGEAGPTAPKISPAARADEIAHTGLFAEPHSAARVVPGPRATGADQRHVDDLAGHIRDGLAEPEADDEDRAAVDKAIRGLLTEAITPHEVHDRLAEHPEITAGADSHSEAVDRVSRDYAARYAALAGEQQRHAPAALPPERFAGMTNTQLRAHDAASQQILKDLQANGMGPTDPAQQVATANVEGAQREMAARDAAAAAHSDVAKAHAQGLGLHERNPEQAATRAEQMRPVLAELRRQQEAKAPPQGGRAERMPHQIQAMIHGLGGRNADGSERPSAEHDTRGAGVPAAPTKPESPTVPEVAQPKRAQVRQPTGAPYTVVGRKGNTATLDYQGGRYQVQAHGGVLAHVVVTDPNGKETHVQGGSTTMLRREQTADRERAVREALHTAHLGYTGEAPKKPSAPEVGAPAETHADALARMSDDQARAHVATLPHSTLVGVDQAMAHRASALGHSGVVTGKHQMVRDAIPAAPHTAVIDGPAQDDIATSRGEMLGLHELPDGHLEVEPEVAARQDRVSQLLTQHEGGGLDLKGHSTERLHGHHRDLSNELRLQQEIARRDAIHPPRRVPTQRTQTDTPRVRPGLAGAALDHAEALRAENPDAINRTHQRLESALRRSRASSDTARVLADHVAGGQTDAGKLDALAGSLRAESRARRNDTARKRTTAKRLDRERITSLLGSVDTELRGRGESPQVAKELGAPRTAQAPPPTTINEGPTVRTVAAEKPAPRHVVQPEKPATEVVKPAPLTDAEYEKHTAAVERTLKSELAAGHATNVAHTKGGKGKIYTPERAQQHKEIVDSLWARHGEHAPREGRSVIAGGLMGAGKSTVLRDHAGINSGEYLTINPDEIKDEMAQRGMVPDVKGLSPMEASTLIHDESSHVANLLAQRAYTNKTNIIWDISMSNRASMDRRITEMAAKGYSKPSGVFVDIPVETSVQRALARHRKGMEQHRQGTGMGGRYAPPSIIRKSASNTSSSANRDTFNSLSRDHQFGSSVVYDNSVAGQAPTKVGGTGHWGVGNSGLATLNKLDTVDERRVKLEQHYRWLNDNGITGPYSNPAPVEKSLADIGAPTFHPSDAASAKDRATLAAMWPKITEGTENARQPHVTIRSLADAVGGNEIAKKNGVAAQYNPRAHHIEVSPTTLNKGEYRKDGLFSESGNATFAEHSVHHEYGHALDFELSKSDPTKHLAMINEVARALTPRKNLGKYKTGNDWVKASKSVIVNHVGTYASSNDRELVAELWAEHRLAAKPSKAAQIVGKYLREVKQP